MDNVITALTSDGMVAPSYWIDPKTGNNYMVTVQYANRCDQSHDAWRTSKTSRCAACVRRDTSRCRRRRAPRSLPAILGGRTYGGLYAAGIGGRDQADQYADRSRPLPDSPRDRHLCRHQDGGAAEGRRQDINKLLANTKTDKNTALNVRGAVVSMNQSFKDFGLGLHHLRLLLVYLILMAQFTSFIDPFIILMAIPPGLAGVVHDPAVHRQHAEHHVADGRDHDDRHRGLEQHSDRRVLRHSARAGAPLLEATVQACKVRLRPILMTSLATLLGMIPMALGTGSGQRAIRAAGARHHRRTRRLRRRHGLSGSRCVPGDPRQAREKTRRG